jgi:hypothetical protein
VTADGLTSRLEPVTTKRVRDPLARDFQIRERGTKGIRIVAIEGLDDDGG